MSNFNSTPNPKERMSSIQVPFCRDKCPWGENAFSNFPCPRNVLIKVEHAQTDHFDDKFRDKEVGKYTDEDVSTLTSQSPALSELAAACAVRVEFLGKEPLQINTADDGVTFRLNHDPYAGNLTPEL